MLVFTCVGAYAQETAQSPETLSWKNAASQYRSLQAIKPSVENVRNSPVFLSRIWPDGSAQLQRLNDETNEWEFGAWGIRCGTVRRPFTPIEIPAHGERKIDVFWQRSTDDWNSPRHFVVFQSTEKRPLKGKYRLVLRYALEPWTVGHYPSAVYSISSSEFTVTDETN